MNRVAEHGGAPRALPEWTRPRRVSLTAFAAALTATLFAVTAPAEEHLLRGGNGPGPAANGPGPGCNLIPPLASTGTKVDISQFPPPDSLTRSEERRVGKERRRWVGSSRRRIARQSLRR